MPKGNNIPAEEGLIKLLLIGYSKAGKTHYSLEAAQEGFNITYMDGDVGKETLKTRPEEIKARVNFMRVGDTIEQSRCSTIIYNMMTTKSLMWNDDASRMLRPSDEDCNIWDIRFGMLNHTDILLIDSWTAVAKSAMRWAAHKEGIVIETASKPQLRNVYGSAGLRLSLILSMIQAARCHVIVIAHPTAFEKQSNPDDKKVQDIKEADKTVDWTRLIPISSSNPHGATVAKHFTDVAWLSPTGFKNQRKMDFRPHPDRDSGGRFTGNKDSEEYSFVNLIKKIDGVIPGKDAQYDSPGILMYGPGEYKPAAGGILQAPQGLSALALGKSKT